MGLITGNPVTMISIHIGNEKNFVEELADIEPKHLQKKRDRYFKYSSFQ